MDWDFSYSMDQGIGYLHNAATYENDASDTAQNATRALGYFLEVKEAMRYMDRDSEYAELFEEQLAQYTEQACDIIRRCRKENEQKG